MTMRPVALITGASSGIGAALVRVFAANGHDLALVSLPDAQLDILADDLKLTTRPLTMAMDLTDRDAGQRVADALASAGLEPSVIVNCAGFGLVGAAAELDLAKQLAMIELNVRVLAELSLRFSDSLIRHRGGILNVASIAAFVPGPGIAVYSASKAFVLSFSEALHRELADHGVRVTTLCAGPVQTPFLVQAGLNAKLPRLLAAQSAEYVAQQAYDGLVAGRRRIVPGFRTRALTMVLPFAPNSMLLRSSHLFMQAMSQPPAGQRASDSVPRRGEFYR
jgi:short-subunit dehydrogenase